MPDENITSVVDYAFNDNAVEMKNALYSAINDKIFAALDQRKQQVAQNFLAQYDQNDEQDENDEEYEDEYSEEDLENNENEE